MSANVKVFGKHNCMQCEFTQRWLNERCIEFDYYDVMEDEGALDLVRSWGFQNVPVIACDGMEPFYGFNQDKLEEVARNVN